MSVFKDQAEFMRACGQTVGELNEYQSVLYVDLVDEEFEELQKAPNEEEMLKELIDTIVVLIGLGHSMGFDMDGAWKEVWESNMSKIDPETGMVLKRLDGKVEKGENYKPADVSKFL